MSKIKPYILLTDVNHADFIKITQALSEKYIFVTNSENKEDFDIIISGSDKYLIQANTPKKIPIIQLISRTSEVNTGASAYLPSPVDTQILQLTLENWLECRRLAKQNEQELIQLRQINENALRVISGEQENFRNLFRQTPEMVCILRGPQHLFEFVNEAHIKALGFDATGKTVMEAQPESVEVHSILDDVFKTGVTAELHEIPVTVTHRLRYFNLTYSASKDAQGQINGVMVLGTEVTAQVLAREALRSQNLALEMTLNDSTLETVLEILARAVETHVGQGVKTSILLMDPTGKYLCHGAAPSLPKEYSQLIDGLAIGPRVGSCGTAAYAGKLVMVNDIASDPLWEGFHDLAARYRLKSCWSMPIRSSRGKLIGTFAIYNRPHTDSHLHDLPIIDLIIHTAALVIERHLEAKEKIKAESALKESERLFKYSEEQLGMAIDVAKVGFYDWDIQKNQITFSEQMRRDWGITNPNLELFEEAIELIHEDDRERVQYLIRDSMDHQAPYHTEYRVKRSDGTLVWVDVRGRIHRDENNRPIRFFGTSVVINEQKEKETALRMAQANAETANTAKGMFLANMSHEIRTPLGAVLGFLDLLKNPGNSPEDLKNYIRVIERNSQQLLRIVDDILDLSKIEADKFSVESISFSLADLINDFVSLMSFKAKEKGLLFALTLETRIPDVAIGDPTRIRQILSNVVGNAIKFTENGHVKLSISFKDEILKMTVEDTGCGISPETSEKLFQPFSQADNSTTRLYGGTGLGLSLTRKLSQALGGNFILDKSILGKSSTFVATVRLTTLSSSRMISLDELETLSKHHDIKNSDSDLFSGLRFLAVDDSPDNQALMKTQLARWGAQVELASNGDDCLKKASSSNFDAILMDIQMPIMDGHAATQKLRANGFTQPIIAVTAHAMKEEQERCKQSGFSGFLSKPIDQDQLRSALAKKSKRSLLIVEDDPDLLALLSEILEDYDVSEASTGKAALSLLESGRYFDLLLLDLTLPDMNSSELMKTLRAHPKHSKLKVLICSGADQLVKRTQELSANDYISKPYDLKGLLQKVESVLA